MGVFSKKSRQKARRIRRVRKKISGTRDVPRIAITQTNKNLYVQVIDDEKGRTLIFISSRDKNLGIKTNSKKNIKVAELVAEKVSEKLKAAKVKSIVLDRRNKKYHGIVKAFAERLREEGIKF